MGEAKENLLIFGATGYVGAYILDAIIKAKDSFGRIAIFTSPGTTKNKTEHLRKLKEQDVEIIVGDVTRSEDVLKAYEGVLPASVKGYACAEISRNRYCNQCRWKKCPW
jgi:uncharacterized protein YbjT (DUF2867 family)